MKKVIILFAAILCLTACLAGCQADTQNEFSFTSQDVIENYDTQSIYIPSNAESQSDDVSEPEGSTDGLLIKSKRYTYEENDIIILNMTNQTSANYIVTVCGTYLDKDGNELKREEQSFDQFSAGYQMNFLFYPQIAFEEFTYTVHTKQTSEPMYAKNVDIQFHALLEWKVPLLSESDNTLYPSIVAEFIFQSKNDSTVDVQGYWVLLNSKDEVILIREISTYVNNDLEFQHWNLYHTKEETLVWPEHMKGEIRGIHAINSVVPV